jgi:hypothetical protein
MLSPWADVVCVGAASIGLFLLWAALDLDLTSSNTLRNLVFINFLINAPHFMASYKLLYGAPDMRRQYPGVTWWTPLVLTLWAIVGLAFYREHRVILEAYFGAAVVSLSWHYTGQVWGMMASYAYLDGIRFEPRERFLIRSGLRILLAWHVTWAIRIWLQLPDQFNQPTRPEPLWMAPLYGAMTAAAGFAFLLSAAGLLALWRRTGRAPPGRALVAWLAIFIWDAALYRWGLPGLFLVQLFHALQYLEFPARVELNRALARDAGRVLPHMVFYVAALLTAAFIVTQFVPGPAMSSVATLVGDQRRSVAPVLLLAFINIHHYFTDGVAWKLSNPEVRKELFAHVNLKR